MNPTTGIKEKFSGRNTLLNLALLLATALTLSSCRTTADVDMNNPESVYSRALALYKEDDLLEAQRLFDVIKLQHPASQYADDAQYYLAEINFKRNEYVLSSYNYNLLRRSYPASEYVKDAAYKSALSYYEMSPSFERDQEYTRRAIQAFAEFQALYPNDPLAKEAGNRINELREKLAQREYSTAELYRKLSTLKSALVYYDTVIEDYPDTGFYESAYLGKIQVLEELKRADDVKTTIENYRRLFPQGTYRDQVNGIARAHGF